MALIFPPYDINLSIDDEAFMRACEAREDEWDHLYGNYLLDSEQDRLEAYSELVRIGAEQMDVDRKMSLLFHVETRRRGSFISTSDTVFGPAGSSASYSDHDIHYQQDLYLAFCSATDEEDFIRRVVKVALQHQDVLMPYLYMTDDHDMSTDILKPLLFSSNNFDLFMARLHEQLFRNGMIEDVDVEDLVKALRKSGIFENLQFSFGEVFFLEIENLTLDATVLQIYQDLKIELLMDFTEDYDEKLRDMLGTFEFELEDDQDLSPYDLNDWLYLEHSSHLLTLINRHHFHGIEQQLVSPRHAPTGFSREWNPSTASSSSSRSFVYCGEVKDHLPARELLERTTDTGMLPVNQADKLGEPFPQQLSDIPRELTFYAKSSMDEGQQSFERRIMGCDQGYRDNEFQFEMRRDGIFKDEDVLLPSEPASWRRAFERNEYHRVRSILEDIHPLADIHSLVNRESIAFNLLHALMGTEGSDLGALQTAASSLIRFFNKYTDGENVVAQQAYSLFMGDVELIRKILFAVILQSFVTSLVKKQLVKQVFIPYIFYPMFNRIDSLKLPTSISNILIFLKKYFRKSKSFLLQANARIESCQVVIKSYLGRCLEK